jgi:hypothetical protein
MPIDTLALDRSFTRLVAGFAGSYQLKVGQSQLRFLFLVFLIPLTPCCAAYPAFGPVGKDSYRFFS